VVVVSASLPERGCVEVATFTGHDDSVWGVAFNHDRTLVVSASGNVVNGTAKVWDPFTGDEGVTFTGHDRSVRGVAFSHDGTLVVSASGDGTAKVWDVATSGSCALVRFLVTDAELKEALGGDEPAECTNLRS
jgi:WD40 repeat protein